MDASSGATTIGGRGSNRSFHGKVASMVITTLKRSVQMPSTTEIEDMITDPVKWLQDYKVGESFRRPHSGTSTNNFQLRNTASGGYETLSTQVWLMGDGSNDSYSNMIRNRVNPKPKLR